MARRKTIALLIDYLGGDYQAGILEGVQTLAAERDVNLLTVVGRSLAAPRPADAAQNEIYERLGSARVDGLVVGAGCIGIYAGAERLTEFCRGFAALPVVSIGACLPGIPSIVISNRRGMRTVLDHMFEVHGCRRVAHVRGPTESEEAEQRYQGYLDALEAHGVALEPRLVQTGNFWINSGAEAADKFMRDGLEFDAVVAANDYMALGVLDHLRGLGRRVPHDVLIAGFDDVPSARTGFRSLTTVRQPLDVLGRTALDTLLRLIAGEEVPARVEHDVELVTRQSCGCAYRARTSVVSSPPGDCQTALFELEHRSPEIRAVLEAAAAIPPAAFGGWAERLLSALQAELSGEAGRFVLELEDILDDAQTHAVVIDEFNAVIGVLRARFARVPPGGSHPLVLDDLWHAAVLLIGSSSSKSQSRQRMSSERANDELRQGVERLSTAFDHETLKTVLAGVLSSVGISSACLSLYNGADRSSLSCLFAFASGHELGISAQPFPATELAPSGFWPDDRRWSHVLMPITFAGEQLGLVTIELGAPSMVYPMLREQIGAALKGAALHREVVRETTRRERAERERLNHEAVIARRLQTGLWPVDAHVPGLEWSASMLPAYEVGGDYFDVLPTEFGCWLCLGDVTGHGLVAGMLMVMLQSIVAGAVASSPEAKPSALISALNPIYYDYLRRRLGLDDHASLVLIRYGHDGSLEFAGFHEEILIWRHARATWERLETRGLWVGAIPEISDVTKDTVTSLDVGDLLVLYTDGASEAPSSNGELFGTERLCEVIGMHVEEPVQAIRDAALERIRNWSSAQRDDITLVIARRTLAAPTAPAAARP